MPGSNPKLNCSHTPRERNKVMSFDIPMSLSNRKGDNEVSGKQKSANDSNIRKTKYLHN